MLDATVPDVAYMIGLLQTDGHHEGDVDKKGRLRVELRTEDQEVLRRLQGVLPCRSSLTTRQRRTDFSESVEFSALSVFDREFRREIARVGVPVGRKSRVIAPPPVSFSQPDYVRGVVDGDGSVGFTASGAPFLSLVTVSPHLALYFCQVISEICGVVRTARPNARDGAMNIMVQNGAAAVLADYLYPDDECLAIPRKRLAARQVARWKPAAGRESRYGNPLRPWSPEEDLIALSYPINVASRMLGRTVASVNVRRWRLRARREARSDSLGQPAEASVSGACSG